LADELLFGQLAQGGQLLVDADDVEKKFKFMFNEEAQKHEHWGISIEKS
jgi:hypothetical protein